MTKITKNKTYKKILSKRDIKENKITKNSVDKQGISPAYLLFAKNFIPKNKISGGSYE